MKLTTITIPASVTTLKGPIFQDSGLQTIFFEEGSQLKTLGNDAFANTPLTAVTILAQTPPTLGRNVFTDIAIAEDLRIYVPRESVDAYKTAYPDLADIIKPIMEGTGIQSVHSSESIVHSEADAWYTLDGRRIQGKPLQKGLYINNGNKIIIK